MRKADVIDMAAEMLTSSDFYMPAHADLFAAMTSMRARGAPVDAITLKAELEARGQLDAVGGPSVLTDLMAGGLVGNAAQYAAVIADLASLREQRRLARELLAALDDRDVDKAAGYALQIGERPVQGGRAGELRRQVLTDDELDLIPQGEPLVAGIVQRATISVLYGPPASGKSFVAVDLALSVATGCWWFGHAVATATPPVLYVIAEGVEGIAARRDAWKQARNLTTAGNIRWLPAAVNLLNAGDVQALEAIVRRLRPELVVIDTLSRCMPGGNENAPEVMTGVVAALDALRRAGDSHVMALHHTPKDGTTARGHSALEGAANTMIQVKADDTLVTLKCTKQKNAKPFPELRLNLVPTGPSAALSDRETAPTAETPTTGALLDVVRDHADTSGLTNTTLEKLAETAGISRASYYRAKKLLLETGGIVNVGTDARHRYVLADQAPPTLVS